MERKSEGEEVKGEGLSRMHSRTDLESDGNTRKRETNGGDRKRRVIGREKEGRGKGRDGENATPNIMISREGWNRSIA